MSEPINPITLADFAQKTESGVSVIDFYTDWCTHCPKMAEILEELAELMAGVNFFKCDADQEPELANQFIITSFPSLVLMRNGKHLATYTGGQNKQAVLSWFNSSQS